VRHAPRRLDPRRFGSDQDVNSAWWHWTVNVLAASPGLGRKRRAAVLTRAGLDVGTSIIEPGCWFFSNRVRFGAWCMINHRCYFDSRDEIVLEDGVGMAPEVMLCTSTHTIGGPENRRGSFRLAPVSIGAGTWLGTRVTVLPGVRVAPGCVVAAGAIVAADTEPNGLYAGVPARRIRDLDDGGG
jgi:maltose O-acetyltransferase